MASRVVSCPNCGGSVEFKAQSSLLSICPYCSSAVARLGDDVGELEILGQVAPLSDLGSPLVLGLSGRWGKLGFTLVGHVQYDHGSGPWNEWHAAFDDGRWGWLAEAQGRVYITFGQEVPGLPAFHEAEVGRRFVAGTHTLTIVERRVARFVSAEGEVPFAVPPGTEVRYADLQGGRGVFGTIDYDDAGEAVRLFLGHELAYEQLFDERVLADVAPGEAAAAAGLNCPSCGASVEILAPDESKRITCSTCGALLDCSKGSELYLLTSAVPRIPEPLVPLGAEGALEGARFTVYGQLVRSVESWGQTYRWTEYLLRSAGGSFRWLVENDGHWSFVQPIDAGDVEASGRRALRHEGESYLAYSSASARVEGLRGEFYWKVSVGDRVGMTDFVRPPFMISEERTAEEITFSKSSYLEPERIRDAFRLEAPLPRPVGIAPHQTNPHARAFRAMVRNALVLSALVGLLALGRALLANAEVEAELDAPFVPKRRIEGSLGLAEGQPLEPLRFDVGGPTNLAVHASSDVDDGTIYLQGRLTNLDTGETRTLGIQVERFGGYAGGDTWSSGARSRTVFLGGLSAGRYELRLEPEWSKLGGPSPSRIRVKVVSDVFFGTHALIVAGLLWIMPVVGIFRYFGFEKRRWEGSDLSE